MSRSVRSGHAVVIGASTAGLTAAAVLAERFEHVTVLERDAEVGGPSPRRGVPQGRHLHVLLGSGARLLDARFPGFVDELVAHGAQRVDLGSGRTYAEGGYLARTTRPVPSTMLTRPLVDRVLHARVGALADVSLRAGTPVRGLAGDAARITGVVLDDGSTVDADLVVDAAGRGARTPAWLAEVGVTAPLVSEIHVDLAYATVLVPRDGRAATRWAITVERPPRGRAGVLAPVEGDRWMCSVTGYHGDRPPDDVEGLARFVASLPAPDIAEVVTPLLHDGVEVATYRYPSSRRRHVDGRGPAGLVATGDSLCSFNPVYGQGMTIAVMEAEALGRAVDETGPTSPDLPRRFARRVDRVLALPWQTAAGADFRYERTTGPRPRGVALTNRYLGRVVRAAHHDAHVSERFVRVQNLLDPPVTLVTPRVLGAALRQGSRPPG